MRARWTAVLASIVALTAFGGPSAAGEVVLDMPAPPKAGPESAGGVADESAPSPAADVGSVALARYARARAYPRDSAWGWSSRWAWDWSSRRGWGRAWAWPAFGWRSPSWYPYPYAFRHPCFAGGGYRVSLSPFHVFRARAWNGGYAPWWWAR